MIRLFLLVGILVCAATGAEAGDPPIIPEAWEGIWTLTEIERECGGSGGTSSTEPDSLCGGEEFGVEGETSAECSGTITDTQANLTCTFTEEITEIPGCSVTFSTTFAVTRTGETYSGTETVMIDYLPACGLPDECLERDLNAVRTGPNPDCKKVPVEVQSWASVKTRFL